ncbi:MAG: 1-acyl-sn-glycerol-3-phosphate acyltransferase, partial [Bradymonadaceae bacterium]
MTTDVDTKAEEGTGESPDEPGEPPDDDGSLLPSDVPMIEEESAGLAEETDTDENLPELVEQLRGRTLGSAMLETLGFVLRFLSWILFSHVLFEKRCLDNIRDAAGNGRIVYVMQSRSLLDYLYFNDAFVEHDLPLAEFANGISTSWLRGPVGWVKGLFQGSPADRPEQTVQALVTDDRPVFLFLEESNNSQEENLEFSQKYLTRLVRAQKEIDEPIYVLPLLLIWEKRPDPQRAGILAEIFGTAQSPGYFRKFIGFFQTVWQSFLKLGQPTVQFSSGVELTHFLNEYPNAGTSDVSELLRDRLVEDITRERHAILGPTGEPLEQFYREMIQRPELAEKTSEIADEEGVPESEVRDRIRDQLEEIAADPSLLVMKFFSSILSLVWYRIYDGFEIDHEGLEQVREATRDSSVVLVPSHKSHIDYLVISYLFYQHGLTVPLVAAGANLNFWPMGPLFRRAGGFFLRRTFRGEDLYPTVFREYLVRQMEQGYPIEFFIEGTRSRTGKLVKPKYGMLDMIVRAAANGRLDSVKLVPISVGYEKIIEERSFRREMLGAEKEQESLGQLLQTPKVLTSKYGRLYVQFSEPIELEEYLDRFDLTPGASTEERDDQIRNLTVRLAHRINYDINSVTVVTASGLVAAVLLNSAVRGIDRRRFLQTIGFLLNVLSQSEREARLSNPLEEGMARRDEVDGPEGREATDEWKTGRAVADVVDEAMGLFEDNYQVEIAEAGDSHFYSVPDEARLELSYYRNNIVHHFVPEALLAMAIHRFRTPSIALEKLREETHFLSRLFKYEWIYEERAEFENVFRRTLEFFERCGWVTIGDDRVEIGGPFPVELHFFRRMILSFLESYAIVAGTLGDADDEAFDRTAFVDRALDRGKTDYLRGRILYHESISKPTFKNAVRLFEDWGILERISEPDYRALRYRFTGEP